MYSGEGEYFVELAVTDNDGLIDWAYTTITVVNQTAVPEFPSMFLPATMIIGFLGAVLLIQRTREH
jgi:hypothetical protein